MMRQCFITLCLLMLVATAAPADSLPEVVQAGDQQRIDDLLTAGADVDAVHPSYYQATALMIAAGKNQADLVARLLAAGADPDRRDKNGDTALNWAVHSGHFQAARLLIEAGADPTLSGHGDALQIALRRGHEELVQTLSLHMDARTRPNGRDTRLMLAVYQDDSGAVGAALAAGADVDARDDVDRPLVHVCARLGLGEALAALLEAGAAVDARDHNGFTALMVAAREGKAPLVTQLLAAGASVNARAEAQGLALTPLHLAAIGGDPEIIRTLAAAGADLDAPDSDGAVPALWALSEQHLEAVVTLLDLGADPEAAHKDGDSVASIARRFQIKPVLEKLELNTRSR